MWIFNSKYKLELIVYICFVTICVLKDILMRFCVFLNEFFIKQNIEKLDQLYGMWIWKKNFTNIFDFYRLIIFTRP